MMKKLTFSLLVVLALPLAMQAQRAVRWTVGVTTPIVSNAPTTFQYVGFSVKASYEKIKNVELGLAISTEAHTRGIQYYHYYSSTFGTQLGAPIEERVTASSVLASLNGTYRWQPEKTVSPLAGVTVGVSNDSYGNHNFSKDQSKWNAFVAPHVGLMLWRHLDVRFSYYVAPNDFNRGMLSIGYKF